MSPVSNRINLLMSQWDNDELPLRGFLLEFLRIAESDIENKLEEIRRMQSIETAEGVWLDYIGYRLGVLRPLDTISTHSYFGFGGKDRATGFDQAPLYSDDQAIIEYIGIQDNIYRALLRAASSSLCSSGSTADVREASQKLYDISARCISDGDGVHVYGRSSFTNFSGIDLDDILGIPAGVGREINSYYFQYNTVGSANVDVTTARQFVDTTINLSSFDIGWYVVNIGSNLASGITNGEWYWIKYSNLPSTRTSVGQRNSNTNSIRFQRVIPGPNINVFLGWTSSHDLLYTASQTTGDALPLEVIQSSGVGEAELYSGNLAGNIKSFVGTGVTIPDDVDWLLVNIGGSWPYAYHIWVKTSDLLAVDSSTAGYTFTATNGDSHTLNFILTPTNSSTYYMGRTSDNEILIALNRNVTQRNVSILSADFKTETLNSADVEVSTADTFINTRILIPSNQEWMLLNMGASSATSGKDGENIWVRVRDFVALDDAVDGDTPDADNSMVIREASGEYDVYIGHTDVGYLLIASEGTDDFLPVRVDVVVS